MHTTQALLPAMDGGRTTRRARTPPRLPRTIILRAPTSDERKNRQRNPSTNPHEASVAPGLTA